MKVIVAENHEEVSRLAADILEETVRANPCCTLGLATGSSPVGMYRELSRRCREEGLDFSRVHSVNLDEYVGLAPTHEQSYRYFMDSNLFDHINIDKANTYVANGTGDIEENLREFNAVLDRTDIDVQVLGVGPDGHLGFNEPGDTLCDSAHKEVLDESIGAYFERLEKGGEDQTFAEFGQKALPMLKRALVKKTVAKSLRRFDILEFPATIRNLFEDNTATRSGSDEASRAILLATQLEGEAEDLLHNVDMLFDAQEGNDFLSFSAENRPDDNMYLMP